MRAEAAPSAGGVELVALDLDGTLTQHRCPLGEENRRALDALGAKYKLLMVGAGACRRIHKQMGGYPIDIVGNYGMEVSRYDAATGELAIVESARAEPDRAGVLERADDLRREFGYERYAGEPVEFHPSGMVTFPLLGTGAAIADKLAFDPDRSRRRAIYAAVASAFPEYLVFIGGSSSYDLVPRPYNKLYALDRYCRESGIDRGDVVFFGDDWEPGGSDSHVFESDVPFVKVEDYRQFAEKARFLIERG